jgi:hypothetical protein
MGSKKPLNFAQALRVKPGDGRQSQPDSNSLPDEFQPTENSRPGPHIVQPQSLASHQTTQSQDSTNLDERLATKPSIITTENNWQATEPPNLIKKVAVHEGTRKDYSKMPSRWGKKDQNYRINAQVAERFKLTCQLNKWNMSDIIQDFLESLITGKPPSHQATYHWWLATQTVNQPATSPHDDLMIDDSKIARGSLSSTSHQLNGAEIGKPPSHGPEDELLAFYGRWTHNQIRDADRAARETVRDIPVDVCKAAILTVFARAKRKINSFQYFVDEIKFTHEATPTIGNDFIQHMMYAIGRDRGLQFVPEKEREWVADMLKARGKL